jgi:PAS domain S-box-containing protein
MSESRSGNRGREAMALADDALDARALVARLAVPAVLLQGPTHVCVACSESWSRVIGGADPIGRPFVDLLPGRSGVELLEALDRVRVSGEAERVVAPLKDIAATVDRPEGSGALEFVCEPVAGMNGRAPGILVQAVDQVEAARVVWERAFLAEASDVLAASLDYDVALTTVTRLAVQGIADWCAIDERMPSGEVRRISVAHPDPAMVRLAHRLHEEFPPAPDAAHGALHVIRTGEPELVPEIPDELLVASTRDEEHLRIIRALGLRSYICVPLIARGTVLGALSLVASESGRRFGDRDLRLAQELARRAAIAIDNARLFRDSEAARRSLEEQAIELEAQAAELQQQAWQLEESQVDLEATNDELERQAAVAQRARVEAEAAGALLDAFFRATPVAVGYLDRNLHYRRVNPALAEIDGLTVEEMVGRSIHEVVPRFAPLVEPLYRQVLDTGQPILNREISGPRPSDPGTTGHYLVNYFPVQGESGEPIGVGLVALDLTELRQAQERENVFAQVLEDSRNEIYLFDVDTLRFLQVNRGARENLGYSMDELRSMTPVDIKPEFTAEQFESFIEPLRRGEQDQLVFETVHERTDGSRYPVDVRLQLSTAGERPLFVALILDATERKRVEQELITARDAAEAASQAKSQFLTVMSHELRTPLNAIVGYEDLLEAGVGGPVTATQKEHLGRIKAGANQLIELVNQILSLARIESGREEVEREVVDLRVLSMEVTSLIAALAAQKGLRLETDLPDGPLPAETDAGKIRQILLNLLGNAVKFTAAGFVELSLAADEQEVSFRVRDTGAGIPESLREMVFEPFVQADSSSTRNYGGTGLGLAVSRELARLLGGNLRVESSSEEGSTFLLRLPRRLPGE